MVDTIDILTGEKRGQRQIRRELTEVLPGRKTLKLWPPRAKQSILTYARLGVVGYALHVVDVPYATHRRWINRLKGYRRAWNLAKEFAADRLEKSLFDRAVHGNKTEVYYKGRLVGKRTIPDTIALIVALKGLRPDKYKERVPDRQDAEGVFGLKDLAILAQRIRQSERSIIPALPEGRPNDYIDGQWVETKDPVEEEVNEVDGASGKHSAAKGSRSSLAPKARKKGYKGR